jgi:hypothetical protein
MLSVFGDESHDPKKVKVFTVAGLLGDERTWNSFRERWNGRLSGLIFHAADCESGFGDFRDMPEPERHHLYRDLTMIVADSGLIGYGNSIDLAGCRATIPSVIEEFPDMPYYDCFLKTVAKLSDFAAHFVPRDKVEFTFDQHRETQYNAGLLYDWITTYRAVVGEKVSFGSRKEPGIQAADLWARELMKRCDSHLFNDRVRPRPHWNTLIRTKRFRFHFTSASEFSQILADVPTLLGFDHSSYERWRAAGKLVDNLSNRFRYFTQLKVEQQTDASRNS